MFEAKALIGTYWINKATDKELYSKIKKKIPEFRKFVVEQLGWRLINNERILKIEKVPAYAEAYMGITDFIDSRDYCIFCALLMFLEDKEDGEQFLLSELTDVIQIQEYSQIDWTVFSHRKSLTRVLKFAENRGLLEIYEGSTEKVSNDISNEILYENTGLSRYIPTSFDYDISSFTSYKDFEREQLQELEIDRGHLRINRVYRQLVVGPAVYWSESDDSDAIYIKNHRQWIQKNLDKNLGGRLDIHKNAAFYVIEENEGFGTLHPKDNMLAELVLNVCKECRQWLADDVWIKQPNEYVNITKDDLRNILCVLKEKHGSIWTVEFRKMQEEKLLDIVIQYMEEWRFIQKQEDRIILYPAVGKFVGRYPKGVKQKGVNVNE